MSEMITITVDGETIETTRGHERSGRGLGSGNLHSQPVLAARGCAHRGLPRLPGRGREARPHAR